MVWLLCDFKILLTVFNQSYNCPTSHYLGRNQLPKPFLILPSLYPLIQFFQPNIVQHPSTVHKWWQQAIFMKAPTPLSRHLQSTWHNCAAKVLPHESSTTTISYHWRLSIYSTLHLLFTYYLEHSIPNSDDIMVWRSHQFSR